MATFDDFFSDRKWRVATEVTGVIAEAEESIVTTFDHGRFEMDGGTFHSPFSSARGKKGVLLQEVSQGEDVPDSRIAVGVVAFRQARKAGAIV